MVESTKPTTMKFLCSYGGKILPRYPDGKLRYHGGETRLLAVHRSIPFSELQAKLADLCGSSAASLRCQLPTEDLDALVSITGDEDLANLIEEYDRASTLKIRAFLSPPKPPPGLRKPASPPSSSASSSLSPSPPQHRRHRQIPAPPPRKPVSPAEAEGKVPYCAYHHHHRGGGGGGGRGNPSHVYLIHNGNHWQ